MPQNQLDNFAKAIRRLLAGSNTVFKPGKRKLQFKFPPKPQGFNTKPSLRNPFQAMFRDMSAAITQVSKSFIPEDYSNVVKNFLPANAVLIKPQYPENSSRIQLEDIDGDSSKALISSYKLNDEIKTLILKKQRGEWYKAAEINNSEHSTLNYRGFTDISGAGKKQLLLGLTSNDKAPTLYGYSLENDTVNEMFKRQYSRFEVLNLSNNKSRIKSQLAIWDKNADDTYNIEIHNWNGTQLESKKDISPYYLRNVIPYHVKKVKQNPTLASNWYNLADALEKSGKKREAQAVIEAGSTFAATPEKRDQFLALKKRIAEK